MELTAYVGRIHIRARLVDIQRLFCKYDYKSLKFMIGYAFVDFYKEDDLLWAIKELNGFKLFGQAIKVEMKRNCRREKNDMYSDKFIYKLKVKNLAETVTWKDLKTLMEMAGTVLYSDAHKYIGSGIVHFASERGIEKALKMFNGLSLHGRRIQLYCPQRVENIYFTKRNLNNNRENYYNRYQHWPRQSRLSNEERYQMCSKNDLTTYKRSRCNRSPERVFSRQSYYDSLKRRKIDSIYSSRFYESSLQTKYIESKQDAFIDTSDSRHVHDYEVKSCSARHKSTNEKHSLLKSHPCLPTKKIKPVQPTKKLENHYDNLNSSISSTSSSETSSSSSTSSTSSNSYSSSSSSNKSKIHDESSKSFITVSEINNSLMDANKKT